jgi:hypothetical protein
MLSILRPLSIAGFTVYQDAANDLEATPKKAVGFYILPNTANFVDDGAGAVSVIVYRRPADDDTPERGGAVVQFVVEPTIAADSLNTVAAQLRTLVGADVPLSLVTFTGGRLDVDIDGVRVLDAGSLSGAAHARHAVLLQVDQVGASQLMQQHTLPIELQYQLSFDHRLAGVTFTGTCDGDACVRITRQVAAMAAVADDPVSIAAGALLDVGAAVVAIDGASDTTRATLQAFAREELTRRLRPLYPPPAGDDDAATQKYSANLSAALHFTLSGDGSLQKDETLVVSLGDALARQDWTRILKTVDLTPPILKVTVRVADFGGLPIAAVKVTLTHHGKRDTTAELLFKDFDTFQSFGCWLDEGDARAYDWNAVIYYKDNPLTYQFGRNGVNDPLLIVDVGEAGLINIDVLAGVVDFAKLPKASVKLRYASTALNATVTGNVLIDAAHTNERWIQPIGEEWSGSFDYQVSWLLQSGTRLDRPWVTAQSRNLVLLSPFAGSMTVTVAASGDSAAADGIEQIVVALRYSDPANGYEVDQQLALSSAHATQTWTVDLVDAAIRAYQYRYVVMHQGGMVRTVPADGGWIVSEAALLTVGDLAISS